jgi:hypothetical protein
LKNHVKTIQDCEECYNLPEKSFFFIISFIYQDTLTTYLPSKIIEKHLLNLLVNKNYEDKWKTLKFFMHIHLQVNFWEMTGRAKVNGFQILGKNWTFLVPRTPPKFQP